MLARSTMTIVMMAIFLIMIGIAWSYPPGSKFMVLVVGLPAVALCALQLLIDVSTGNRRTSKSPIFDAAEGEELPPRNIMLRREIIVWGYFLAFIAVVLFFGFWVAIPILIFTFLWQMADIRFTTALLTAVISTPILFLFFEKLLETQLHRGFLTPGIWEQLEKIEALAPFLRLFG